MADGNPPPMRSFAQAASTEEIVVPSRVVQIDGLVALKIIKHCKECMPALVTGQLLGLDIGSILEVTNCFPFPVWSSTKLPESHLHLHHYFFSGITRACKRSFG
jgi:hypothetical protein